MKFIDSIILILCLSKIRLKRRHGLHKKLLPCCCKHHHPLSHLSIWIVPAYHADINSKFYVLGYRRRSNFIYASTISNTSYCGCSTKCERETCMGVRIISIVLEMGPKASLDFLCHNSLLNVFFHRRKPIETLHGYLIFTIYISFRESCLSKFGWGGTYTSMYCWHKYIEEDVDRTTFDIS